MKKSTKTFKCSDPNQNVYGFSVKTEGIKLDSFLQNPVCLLNHNYDKVMGAWEDVVKMGTTLQGVPVFDTEDPEANKYYGQVERDVIKGASIGIIPLAMSGNEITESELLEISITPVPANRNALVIYNAKGVKLNAKEAKAYMLSISNDTNKEDENKSQIMNKELLAALVLLCAQSGVSVNLAADASDEDIKQAITAVGNKISALNLSVTTLTEKNKEYATKELNAQKAEAEAAVNAAIADKRITADKKETFLKLFASDAELAKSTLEALKPVNLTVIPGAEEAAAKTKEQEDRKDWPFEKWLKEDSVGLSAMQANDTEKFNALYAGYVANLKATGAIQG